MNYYFRFIVVSLLLLIAIDVSAQSKIKTAKGNLSGDSSPKGYTLSESSSYSDDSPSFFGELAATFIFQLSVGLLYYTVIETPFEMDKGMHHSTLNPYPFYNKNKGDYQYAGSEFVLWRADISNYYFSEKGKVNTNQFNTRFRIGDRFAVSGAYTHMSEKLINEPNQKMDILFITADYYRVRTPHVNLLWGLGAGFVGNEVSQWGFVINTGAEIFIRPFSIESDLRYGAFRFDSVLLFSVGPKFHFRKFNIGAKYQSHNIGRVHFSGISFGGGVSF
ncbi:MAG: hypothetical protein Q4G08_09815 [Capnocytophaga sp.]|nr:hypothetical protein [Capnocytophaga sp.]